MQRGAGVADRASEGRGWRDHGRRSAFPGPPVGGRPPASGHSSARRWCVAAKAAAI